QAAGVGKGTIYRYFKDKDDLFFSTAAQGFEDLWQHSRSHPHQPGQM
ncbi:MAG: TetR/AcrR family transcriptional regulator, partial [Phycisphaerales bacterium]|nr:TetR/AcrR family transcriptional regulator [Phycisphaerales bacterium]